MKDTVRTLVLATVVALMSCAPFATAATARQEDFATFFERFGSDSAFRISRVSIPLTVMLDPTEVPRKEYAWSIEQVQKEMITPHPKSKLGGLKEKVTRESEGVVKVTQMEPESDVYCYSYYFRQTKGQWFLYRYEDASL